MDQRNRRGPDAARSTADRCQEPEPPTRWPTRGEVVEAVQTAKAAGGAKKSRGAAAKSGGKSKGAGRVAKKRVFKIPGGKVTIERAKGVDDEALEAAIAAIRTGHSAAAMGTMTASETPTDPAGSADGAIVDDGQGRGVAA